MAMADIALARHVRERIRRRGRYPTAVLLTALTGMFATTFPVTVLTVAIPQIAEELDTTETTLAWVVTLPMLLSALALPVLGKLGDLYGHRRVFLIGFALATVTTALTATAGNAFLLIAWRTLTQITGAATGPTSMALINNEYPPERRHKAMGYWAMVAAASPAIGLVIGGLLIDLWGWRFLFLLQAVFMAVAASVAFLVLRETPRRTGVRFDIRGSVTLMVGTAAFLLVLDRGRAWGFSDPRLLLASVVAPLAFLAFVRAERRARAPLLPLDFFRRHDFSASIAGTLFTGASYMGAYFITPFLFLGVFGYSVAATSWILLIRPVVFAASSPLGGSLTGRLGKRRMAVLGQAILALSLLVLALGAGRVTVGLVVVGLVLQGLGHGLTRPPTSTALANSVDNQDLGIAAASERMMFQVGSALGITVLTVVYGGVNTASTFVQVFLVAAVLALAGMVSLSFLRPESGRADDEDAARRVG